MYFRAILDDNTCCILQGKSLAEVRVNLEHNRFVHAYNKTTGNEELISTRRIRIVRKSSKTLETIVEESQQAIKKLKGRK